MSELAQVVKIEKLIFTIRYANQYKTRILEEHDY